MKIFISNEELLAKIDENERNHSNLINECVNNCNNKIGKLDSKCTEKLNEFDSKFSKKIADIDSKNSTEISNIDQKISKQFNDLDAKYSKQIKELETKFENKIQEINQKHKNEIDSLNEIIDGLKKKIDDIEKENQSNLIKNEKRIKEIEQKEENFGKNQIKLREEMDSQKTINSLNEERFSKFDNFSSESANKLKSLQDEMQKQKLLIENNEIMIANVNDECIKTTNISYDNNPSNRFNGIISWLGNKNPENLIEKGILDVTASSTYNDADCRKPINVFIYQNDWQCFHSKNEAGSWLCIDFKEKRVSVSHYSIHAHGRSPNHHLQNWDIDGSNDKEKWVNLDSRQNEKSISSISSSNTFEVQNKNNRNYFYRFIRIKQTGLNSSGNNELYFSSIEFFGRILQI